MSEVLLDIKKWGNSLGMRIPAAVAREAHLHLDQTVSLTVDKGRVVINPVKDKLISLEARLANYDPTIHGGESMQTTKTLGAEKW